MQAEAESHLSAPESHTNKKCTKPPWTGLVALRICCCVRYLCQDLLLPNEVSPFRSRRYRHDDSRSANQSQMHPTSQHSCFISNKFSPLRLHELWYQCRCPVCGRPLSAADHCPCILKLPVYRSRFKLLLLRSCLTLRCLCCKTEKAMRRSFKPRYRIEILRGLSSVFIGSRQLHYQTPRNPSTFISRWTEQH